MLEQLPLFSYEIVFHTFDAVSLFEVDVYLIDCFGRRWIQDFKLVYALELAHGDLRGWLGLYGA